MWGNATFEEGCQVHLRRRLLKWHHGCKGLLSVHIQTIPRTNRESFKTGPNQSNCSVKNGGSEGFHFGGGQ